MSSLIPMLLLGATVLHFGALHPYERWLAIFLAFAPFVGLAVVMAVRRRQEDQAAHQDGRERDESGPG